ncbi:DUF3788 domain-containing protein [Hoeflea prorocentri]|uniref:DUF3788 domain-containing protein n=1 Tax=Hoeflea prorocentri TaxID=1922333 RepID=A0A9X3UH67_9HYPH|nr:DUF3788 domain-containing protein [Hoeflea prorocentri]MCY6380768.1 DUF3788 domain-containing protein [Hoeflea prorocentri]MDA5398568.1 DUF3788 domain-containing protein [Hoeflea prorocentri]
MNKSEDQRNSEAAVRIVSPDAPPDARTVKSWIGASAYDYWRRLGEMIDALYPGVFVPEWLNGGKKHGWSLRYKKSRSFCTFIPERNAFKLQITFGSKERSKVALVRDQISPGTLEAYDNATTYHDGKWLLLTVDDDVILHDTKVLLSIKRKPKANSNS